ncbi:MAG: DUF4388 domain-containing protein [Myxococcota bacterium]
MSVRIQIAKNGRVRLQGELPERHRERGYALVETPASILLGVDELREAPEGQTLVLAGDLTQVPFPEVVTLIAHGRRSAVLRVYGSSVTRTVVFRQGEVRGTASQRAGEHLDDVAVRMGLVERKHMDDLVHEFGDARHAGRVAVERGMLSERDLWNAVQEHVTTVFQAILLETKGSFVLTDEEVDESLLFPGLSAEGLLMEGVRRLDELRVGADGDDHAPRRVLIAFNSAFRDIFATAADAGAGSALHRAVESVFDDDPAHATFRGLRFAADGELPEDVVMGMLDDRGFKSDDACEQLSSMLSTVMLFLLFVAGEHLEATVHQALHARVKSRIHRN